MTSRSDLQIVEQTNTLARAFYKAAFGCTVRDDHKFYETTRRSYHPHEAICWKMACEAQLVLTGTDPDDALSALEA